MRRLIITGLLLVCAAAHAQVADFSATAGLKVWSTEWSTFTYNNGQAAPGNTVSKVLLIPSVVGRWRNFAASVSGFRQSYGGGQSRREWDANLGFQPVPNVAFWIGYKKVGQYDGLVRYEPKGPTASVSVSTPLDGAWSLYGSVGLGRLKTPPPGENIVSYDRGPYRVMELGFGYGVPVDGPLRSLSLTFGYRTQVIVTNGINSDGSGRFNDLTQGLALGVVTSF